MLSWSYYGEECRLHLDIFVRTVSQEASGQSRRNVSVGRRLTMICFRLNPVVMHEQPCGNQTIIVMKCMQ